MIKITTLTNATAQIVLNTLKDMGEWHNVTEADGNVSAIEITKKIKVEPTASTILKFTNSNITGNNNNVSILNVSGTIVLVQTDDAILVTNGTTADFFVIDKTTDLNDNESMGVVMRLSNNIATYSDTSTGATMFGLQITSTASLFLTQLVPAIDISGTCTFKTAQICLALTKRSTVIGKTQLNGKHYFICPDFAIEYTP